MFVRQVCQRMVSGTLMV
ncbi:UNVERIFIED_CONTAM: hypothetical protein GTU68_037078 [Idotea baltica]|nr:hypothetical protein [Idotea baltica]